MLFTWRWFPIQWWMMSPLYFTKVVLRIFRFQNQTEGDSYLQSKQPVFYIKGDHPPHKEETNQELLLLPQPFYNDRSHRKNIHETVTLQKQFTEFQTDLLDELQTTYDPISTPFAFKGCIALVTNAWAIVQMQLTLRQTFSRIVTTLSPSA